MSEIERKSEKLDPRVRRSRQLLRQALSELMAEKSFQSITVQDIAGRATLNRGTFYAHFEDKYALLEHSVRESFRLRLRRELPEGSPFTAENLERMILVVCDFLAEMHGHCPPPHAPYEPLMEKQIKAEINDVLRAWLADRRVGMAGPDLAAGVASWAIYGAAVQWSQREERVSAKAFARKVLPLILTNLQSESVDVSG